MITHTIRTSKYKTTIDIPAEKLQTRAKFIQIPKQRSQQEVISIPQCYNSCCSESKLTQQKMLSNQNTRLIIQELEKAYNDDMIEYQKKLQVQKNQYDKEISRLQGVIEAVRKEGDFIKKASQNSELEFQKRRREMSSQLSQVKSQLVKYHEKRSAEESEINRLRKQNEDLKRQRSQIICTKIKEYTLQKQSIWQSQLVNLKDALRNKDVTIQSLQQKNKEIAGSQKKMSQQLISLKEQLSKMEKIIKQKQQQIEFQDQQLTNNHNEIKKIQKEKLSLEQEKESLERNNKQFHEENQMLLQELKKQREFLEHSQGNKQSQLAIIIENVRNEERLLFEQEKDVLLNKLILSERKVEQIQRELYTAHSQLKETQQTLQRQGKIYQEQTKENYKIKEEYQKLQVLLSQKLLVIQQLQARPKEEKVYEVKIEKSIQRKEYIKQLEEKLNQKEKIIQELKVDNQSYVEEIERHVRELKQANKRQSELKKNIQDLSSYINEKEKSLSWIVQREIAKDIELNQQGKLSQYKVYVNASRHDQAQDVSVIQKTGAINFSIESNVQKILDKRY